MKYKEYNDFELISYVKEQIEEANEILIDKYMPLINKIAKKFDTTYGIDLSDIRQEGLIGLSKAIKTYSEVSNTTFYTYAKKCIESSILNLIRNYKCNKHVYLNESISFDNQEIDILNMLTDNINPLSELIDKEDYNMIYQKVKDKLSDFEYEVFKLKLENYNNKEISLILNTNYKKVDNALLRIKNKLKH